MLSRPVVNPPNPWLSTEVEYLEEPPATQLTVYEDHSKSILATNDSPDIGFRWSVNPYRGCQHACAYCLSGDTQILMANGRTRLLADVRVGDEIYGTTVSGRYHRYVQTTVLAHWATHKPAHRVELEDGTQLIASGDHRFLTERGWKFVTGAEQGRARRPHLTLNNKLMGTGAFAAAPMKSLDYKRGYLCGMVRGDGLLKSYSYHRRPERTIDVQHQFRLALVDLEGLQRTKQYLLDFEVATSEFVFKAAVGNFKEMHAIRTSARGKVDRVRELIEWPAAPGDDWCKGFLAGIFDAEGSYSRGILRVANADAVMIERTVHCARRFGFDCIVEETKTRERPMSYVRIRRGLREHLRFFHTVDPAITRKRDIDGQAIKNNSRLRIVAIQPLGVSVPLFDITTGTGDFIANGVVSHNCYARPSHEYLGLGAGTDFDTKIVVKPRAPALLRAAFEKKAWRGELVMFSGVTDCYQPLEASYRLTRACLEVCAEYKNPVGIITKAPLVERDLDLLLELTRVARVRVMMSIPIWDKEKARAIEPYVATPERRVRTIERLARAGVAVGVMVAPIIPGLNDGDIPQVLEAARAAGATHAGYVLLRLPGSVLPVFEERIAAALPLRAERILNRIRETRGGDKMYDGRFGVRGRGQGEYAQMIGALFETSRRRLGFADSDYQRDGDGQGQDNERDSDDTTSLPSLSTFTRPEKPAPEPPAPKRQLNLF